MSELNQLEPGTVVAEKLRVVRLLGEGGMGAVYEVEHVYTKHRRALKLLHESLAEHGEIVQRFLREASAAGRIGSKHIVETSDAGRLPSGAPYLVMEFLQGKPLDAVIHQQGSLSVGLVVELMGQACEGIQAAHDAGIVHRDIKPENLFLAAEADGTPLVKVLDFGISKFDPSLTGDHSLTRDGACMGTPYYMSPEQMLGQPVDERSDVYSLGVVAYECLAGRRPFEAETLGALSVLIHGGQCEPLESLRVDLPSGVASAVRRAMAREREQRFRRPADFAAELRRGLPAHSEQTLAHFGRAEARTPGHGSGPQGAPVQGAGPQEAPAHGSGPHAASADGTRRSTPGPSGTVSLDTPIADALGTTTQHGALSQHPVGAPSRTNPLVVAGLGVGALVLLAGVGLLVVGSGRGGAEVAATPESAAASESVSVGSVAPSVVALASAPLVAATPESSHETPRLGSGVSPPGPPKPVTSNAVVSSAPALAPLPPPAVAAPEPTRPAAPAPPQPPATATNRAAQHGLSTANPFD